MPALYCCGNWPCVIEYFTAICTTCVKFCISWRAASIFGAVRQSLSIGVPSEGDKRDSRSNMPGLALVLLIHICQGLTRQKHPCSGASVTDSAVGDPTRNHVTSPLQFKGEPMPGLTIDWGGRSASGLDWSRLPERHRTSVVAQKPEYSIPGSGHRVPALCQCGTAGGGDFAQVEGIPSYNPPV